MKKFLIFTLILCTFFSALVFAQPKVNAATHDIPYVADVWDSSTYPYAVVVYTYNSGQYWFSCSSAPFEIGFDEDTMDSILISSGNSKTYKLNSTGIWVFQSNNPSQFGVYTDLVYSTHLIGSFDPTTDFFYPPLPLHQIVEKVGVTSVKSQWSQILGGTIPILTACGVGCLALLIVLKLFGKKSLIFRR